MIDGVINCPKSPTTEPRCHSDQVDPLVHFEASSYADFRPSVCHQVNLHGSINRPNFRILGPKLPHYFDQP